MTLTEKYNEVISFSESLGADNVSVQEDGPVLRLRATVQYPYHKNIVWDKIKYVGGQSPSDLVADIEVSDSSCFAKHVVEKGDTLGKIAEFYLADPAQYKAIFEANKDILDNPDVIQPGQVLTIPNV